ncbi:ABC transporter ATP-binding protein [uncultured Nisaea sp.]|uniref:ABC transporter ATP-binding protein n=1 Tax=uncultured Nisaea sp. TaxID=538215 RepID=UPI0030EBBB77|tara:strand:+ start:2787 stop:3632 length:846 start_codon:yes stop_codon:yes gene_type:complete
MTQEPDPGQFPLEAKRIVAGYGGQSVLRDVFLSVPAKSLTVLVGPNGSGKSTLLALLSRLLKPSDGSVLLDGRALSALPTREIARKLGILPQSPLVPEGITVYDLVSRGRYPHQGFLKQWTETDEAAVESALAVTDTQDFADRPVDSLSGGQRQRCFIALTLAQETGIILFDEPTSYLDLRYQVEVMELIARLPKEHGRTVVTVLHDLNFAMQYADRLVFLKSGAIHRLVEDPEECSAELVREVFETPVIRLHHPETGKPIFLPAQAAACPAPTPLAEPAS